MEKHPNNMSKEELKELVFAMVWAALDLGQHLNFTMKFLDGENKEKALYKAIKMAYEITEMPYKELPPKSYIDISYFGETGLEKGGVNDK